MRGDALQMFRSTSSPSREFLGKFSTVFRKKYVKSQSMATPKYKIQQLLLNLANQKLFNFLDELQKLAKDSSGVSAQAFI